MAITSARSTEFPGPAASAADCPRCAGGCRSDRLPHHAGPWAAVGDREKVPRCVVGAVADATADQHAQEFHRAVPHTFDEFPPLLRAGPFGKAPEGSLPALRQRRHLARGQRAQFPGSRVDHRHRLLRRGVGQAFEESSEHRHVADLRGRRQVAQRPIACPADLRLRGERVVAAQQAGHTPAGRGLHQLTLALAGTPLDLVGGREVMQVLFLQLLPLRSV